MPRSESSSTECSVRQHRVSYVHILEMSIGRKTHPTQAISLNAAPYHTFDRSSVRCITPSPCPAAPLDESCSIGTGRRKKGSETRDSCRRNRTIIFAVRMHESNAGVKQGTNGLCLAHSCRQTEDGVVRLLIIVPSSNSSLNVTYRRHRAPQKENPLSVDWLEFCACQRLDHLSPACYFYEGFED